MAEIKEDLLYTADHEWVQKLDSAKRIRVGISDFAQSSMGDVTFIEMPEEGAEYSKGDSMGSIESVKAVSDLYAPMSGRVCSVNKALEEDPALLNSAPYGDGWILELEVSNEDEEKELLNSSAYSSHAE